MKMLLLMAENEEQGREKRRLEMRLTELDVCKEGLEEDDREAITFDIVKIEKDRSD